MKNLNIALRSLFKKGRSNGIKILSLGVGLAMGPVSYTHLTLPTNSRV